MSVLPSDHEARQAARRRLDRNVVVVAGAGTGKTTLLTDRILLSLLGPEPAPPITSLVALTFTEKAAGEIRLRLAERLLELSVFLGRGLLGGPARERAGALLEELDSGFGRSAEETRARARAALEDLDRAQIGTIHSFAAHLLRLYPLQAGVDPGFRVDEGPLAEELFETRWAQWLDRELGEVAPRRREWLEVLRRTQLEELAELARGLCSERVDLAAAGEPDPEAARRLRRLAAALREAPRGQPEVRRGKIAEALAGLAGHLDSLAEAASAPEPPISRPAVADLPQAKWPAAWDQSGAAGYESARRIAEAASAGGEALVRRAARLLVPFARDFRKECARAGLISFDGLLLRARDLVRGDLSAREELKARYRLFLIDEFQDTDPLQGELILFLAEEPGGRARTWREVRPGPGRLFIVGDPKQSIYRFRGADIAAYQGITDQLLRDGGSLLCELRANFRSTAAVLGPINGIFPRLMSLKEGSQPEYIPVSAHQAGGAAAPAWELAVVGLAAEGGTAPDALTSQKTQAAWIAARLAAECGGGGGRRFKDAAVLMRTSSALGPLLDAFKSAGIPYVVEMERLFYDSQEIIDLLNLLRALDDPEDRPALAGLLRSPLLALGDEDLLRWAAAGRPGYGEAPPASWPAPQRRRAGKVFAALRALRGRVGRAPLGEFVEAVLRQTPLLPAAARAYHGQQTISNLLKFSRMAAAAADERGLTLKEFVAAAARAMEESRAEGESPLADEHLDAVRVLSIHKAKGLEFPLVFLYNLTGGSARGGDGGAALTDWSTGRTGLRLAGGGACGAARALSEDRERRRRQDETVRLLYVALTRAKERLVLLGAEKADGGTLAGILKEAGAWPAASEAELRLAGGAVPVIRLKAGGGAARPAAARGALAAGPLLPAARILEEVREGRLRRRDEAAARRWTRRPTEETPAPTPGPARPGHGVLVGQLCHKVLAGWDFRGRARLGPALEAACRGLAAAQPGEDWEAARREAEPVLSAFLASAAARELAEADILGREVPFVYGEDGAVVRGTMDLVYRQEGRMVVADYKSEAVSPRDLPRLRDRYARQGDCYRAAVARAWGVPDAAFRLIFLRRPEL
ncbi:MAG: UvrD-helicase domain-containing protein [Elusimicrobia bacterium]|nr:UvrD-helicase domain-containing protein [Elusimicrobiota bacterium]